MLLLLVISLIFMLFMAFTITGKDILSPWVISICMFLISSLVALLNYKNWNEDIGAITVLVIVGGVLFFGLGEICSKVIVTKKGEKNTKGIDRVQLIKGDNKIVINRMWILLTSLFILVVLYFFYQYTQRLAMLAGYKSGFDSMLYYARHAQFDQNINSDQSSLLNIGITFSRVLSYFFIFVFLYNNIFFKFKITSLLYLLPAIINTGIILLTTGRTQFINLITFFLIVLFIMLKQKNNGSRKMNKKVLMYGIIGIILFLTIFRLSGYLTGKSEVSSTWENVSKYVGSSIIALDKYFTNPPEKYFFGKETFYAQYHVLRKFGFDIPQYNLILEFRSWKDVDNVNIYTSLRRYIQDFGVLGMLFIQFFLGVFYGGFYRYIRIKNKIGIGIVIYAMIFFPIVQYSLEERFFMNVLSIAGAYNLIAITIIWYFFLNRRKIKSPLKI